MNIRKLTQDDYITTAWSGGTTTQAAIWPEGALYADRDFIWRVSTALVELPESDFTPLPDYDRLISTLEGEMELSHEDGRPFTLSPFQVYAFPGGQYTHSRGTCRDFNLMLRKGRADGTMEPLTVMPGTQELRLSPKTTEALLYVVSGTLCAAGAGKGETLQAGESLLITEGKAGILTLRAEEETRLMVLQMERS